MKLSWKKIESRSQLPNDGTTFLCLWRGRISLCQYDKYEEAFYLLFDPADHGNFRISQERENSISHIIILDYPDVYPDDFVSIK